MRQTARISTDSYDLAMRYAFSMHISDKGLQEFIAICKEDYGVALSQEDARVAAIRALLLYELIHRPFPNEMRPR